MSQAGERGVRGKEPFLFAFLNFEFGLLGRDSRGKSTSLGCPAEGGTASCPVVMASCDAFRQSVIALRPVDDRFLAPAVFVAPLRASRPIKSTHSDADSKRRRREPSNLKRRCVATGDDGVARNTAGLTDMFWTLGQFLDHDLDLTPENKFTEEKQPGFLNSRVLIESEEFPIEVPDDEHYFINNATLEFKRSEIIRKAAHNFGPADYINKHSAYADLGQVYGTDYFRANALRTFSGGKLKMSPGGLLPKNKVIGNDALGAKVSNAPDGEEKFYVAGDIRANEQITLLSMHVVWAREHNRVCDELKELFPDYDDQLLFSTARAIVISTWQSIVYSKHRVWCLMACICLGFKSH